MSNLLSSYKTSFFITLFSILTFNSISAELGGNKSRNEEFQHHGGWDIEDRRYDNRSTYNYSQDYQRYQYPNYRANNNLIYTNYPTPYGGYDGSLYANYPYTNDYYPAYSETYIYDTSPYIDVDSRQRAYQHGNYGYHRSKQQQVAPTPYPITNTNYKFYTPFTNTYHYNDPNLKK